LGVAAWLGVGERMKDARMGEEGEIGRERVMVPWKKEIRI
jgi:hypothetical protein